MKRSVSAELSSVELPPKTYLCGDVVSYPYLALTIRANRWNQFQRMVLKARLVPGET